MKQKQALSVMLGGASVFLTGPPGAGKTFVLNDFIRRAKRRGKTVAVTASTGIAATHIGGSTIHSWSGLGIADQMDERLRHKLGNTAKLATRYNATDILVIDEVSMLRGGLLDMVNEACQLVRGSGQPFGGLQVILVGDLFQLPPVTRGGGAPDFVHFSRAWQNLDPQICYLSEQHRQSPNDGLLDLLEAMRSGEFEDHHDDLIKSRLGIKPSSEESVTRLYAHNVDIDTLNQTRLAIIDGKTYYYEIETSGASAKIEQLRRSILAPDILELKIGAEVMFVANNPSLGFYNGSRGRVTDFKDNQPIVELTGRRRRISVSPHSWKLEEDGRVRAEVSQLPLRLAWAITIHKSQGMSLDSAEIDLSRSFTPGMGYVALSRVRSLDGLYLSGINNIALSMHEEIYEFDRSLRQTSKALAAITPEAKDAVEVIETEKPEPNQALLKQLKSWRLARSRSESVPPYVIAHDSVFETIAAKLPDSKGQLLAIKGFGPAKLEKYGADILSLVAKHNEKS